ncbi:hypothetical protein V5O48_018687 [Marasmius crinis-equi]|uniref:Uncharacterized protein n=1 Tax=Marasmius crinis-equi TaxID=585013 RepID=A0ABR3EKF6_9AGAR
MAPSYPPILNPLPSKQDRQKARLLPFSLILLIIWIAFIAAVLCLLESSVRLGPRQDIDSWLYRSLASVASILRTVFIQAHVPITAMFLARVAVSALQNARSTPNSWTELFWLADREWMGPMGIIKVTYQSVRSRKRASLMFILFGTTCTTALLTPVFLIRAYQVQQITVIRNTQIDDTQTIHGDHLLDFPLLTIQAAAMGPWAMNASVLDIYSPSLFTPALEPLDYNSQPQTFFFTSDIGFANATLPGLHLNGSCAPMSPTDISSAGLNVDTMAVDTYQAFTQFCNSNIPRFQGQSPTNYFLSLSPPDLFFELSLQSCNNFTIESSDTSQTQNVGYFYYRYAVREGQVPELGLIRCLSNLTTGTANVSGFDFTYTDLNRKSLFEFNSTEGSTPVNITDFDPMMLAFSGLNLTDKPRDYTLQDGLVFSGLGFAYVGNGNSRLAEHIASPSPDDIARNLWSAIAHSVAALGVLAKDDAEPFDALESISVAVFTRSRAEALCTYVLLALWLALIVGITAWGYRRTFSHNLDSYVAAELLFRERWLLEDVPMGGVGDNDRLKAPFKALGLHKEDTGQMGFESEKFKRSDTGASGGYY